MNSFTIYKEYYELITLLNEKEQQELLLAITRYMFEDIEPKLNDKQNKKINIIEQKAMEMVKAQQVISEKLKRELNNAINYYEGIIANYQGGK